MTPKTKAESPPEVIAAIDSLERQSDRCYEGLKLLDHEWNFAAWLSLTECIRRIELSVTPTQYGSGHHKIVVMNLGRAAAQMYKFAREHAKSTVRSPSTYYWSPRLGEEAAIAFRVAWEYSMGFSGMAQKSLRR